MQSHRTIFTCKNIQTCIANTVILVYALKDIAASSGSDAVTIGSFCLLVPRPVEQHLDFSRQDNTKMCRCSLRMCHQTWTHSCLMLKDEQNTYIHIITVPAYHRVPLIPPKRCSHISESRSLIHCDSRSQWRHRHVSSRHPLVVSCHDNQ